MNGSCYTYEWVMAHIWMSQVTHEKSTCLWESDEWTSHITYKKKPRHTYKWVIPHIWMSHVIHFALKYRNQLPSIRPEYVWMSHLTRIYESRETYGCVMTDLLMGLVTHMNEECHTIWISIPKSEGLHTPQMHMKEWSHTYGWVMSETWMRHVRLIDGSCYTFKCHSIHINWPTSEAFHKPQMYMNKSSHTYECVMSDILMRHVTRVSARYQTYRHVDGLSHRYDI